MPFQTPNESTFNPSAATALTAAPFAQPTEAGTQPSESFNPLMFGDFLGPNSVTTALPGGLAGYKISENESPRPLTRAYINYNYYDQVRSRSNGVIFDTPNYSRETFGIEKAFWDGDASFGMRLAFIQFDGERVNISETGDLNFLFKYALVNDRSTGNLFSTGLTVSAPTGTIPSINGPSEGPRPTIIQPFLGYIYNMNDLYIHGFSSVAFATISEAPTFAFNSFGVGYYVYRNDDGFVKAIVPTFETHVNTPLTNRSAATGVVQQNDQVDLTYGAYFLFQRSVFGFAFGTPVVGPTPYDYEFICSFNYRF